MASRDVTTAVVVDCPTPFAPPVVVKPQLQPITAIKAPKQKALITVEKTSQTSRKLRAESIKIFWEMPYILPAISIPPAMPVSRDSIVKIGNIKQQAMTRGITR